MTLLAATKLGKIFLQKILLRESLTAAWGLCIIAGLFH